MHTLLKKRGNKTTTHYFHHITEKGGDKKQVYLGTDLKSSRKKLTKLQLERIESKNKLSQDIEEVKAKLNKIAHHHKSPDQILADIKKEHYKQKKIEMLLAKEERPARSANYVIAPIVTIAIGVFLFYFLSNPTITGATTSALTEVSSNKTISTIMIIALLTCVIGFIVGAAHHKYKR